MDPDGFVMYVWEMYYQLYIYMYICIYVYMYIYICVYICIDIYSPIVALSFFQGPWVTTISLISAGVNQETEPSRSKDLST